ncbi:MAG: DNA polymerase III subunit gamma/tau [Candidatus Syntrophonatronum acetioxidans]|uniref:DNA-directed DNA polymerase n=1 Tax=Candidatus Syntrophonatronum acetioxidans TaxID=1795816 RepID=A0A424Y9Z6_9FIRM|nr:MAG: DNA polymerase III subunit gamma/tau [Candidatus Syntrophonatronum acetioxidans]
MSYLALYRKWRPQNFEDLIGQPHITRTLINALKGDRISHAYLFCGPRGTGKTSAAKIMAKALNCEKGPGPTPCNQCSVCQGINRGMVMDVLEIDAASNRGIDEIRELRSRVRYGSTEGRFKIYIIDEVHMLTQEAFNALLKTLEEPPAGVVFILATTEPHKLPATILSRCQRFDFHRIGIPTLVEGLSRIAFQEGVEIEEEALRIIARSSEGGMRDALGLLEQVVSFSDGPVDLEGAKQVLGIEEEEVFISLGEAVLNNDLVAALRGIQKVVDGGRDIAQFLRDLTNYFRGLILLRIQGEEALEIPWASLARMREQARAFSPEGLLAVNEVLTEAVYQLRGSSQPRFVLETAVFQICHMDYRLNIKELQKKVEKLEEELLRRDEESYPPPGVRGKKKEEERGYQGYQERSGAKGEELFPEFPEHPETPESQEMPENFDSLEPPEAPQPTPPPEAIMCPEGESRDRPEEREVAENPGTREDLEQSECQENPELVEAPESPEADNPTAPRGSIEPGEPAEEKAVSLDNIQRGWSKILKSLSRRKVITCSWLESSNPLCLEGKLLTIEVKNSVAQGILEKEEHQNNIKEVIKSFTGEELLLKFIVEEKDKNKKDKREEKNFRGDNLEEEIPDDEFPWETDQEDIVDFDEIGGTSNLLNFQGKEEGDANGEGGLLEEALEIFEGKIMEEDEFKKGGFFNEGKHGKDDEAGTKNAGGHG